jgi:hypothetical protein
VRSSPFRPDLLERPLLVGVVDVARHQGEVRGLGVERYALLVHPVEYCVGVFVVEPGPVDRPHAAEGELDSLGVGLDAPLAHPQLPLRVQSDQLVVAETVAVLDGHQRRRSVTQGVQTLADRHRAHLAEVDVGRQLGVLVEDVVGHVLHEPLETLAVESLLQGELFGDVAHVEEARHGLARVEVLLVLVVEPGLYDALVVDGDERSLLLLGQLAEVVRHEAPVDVSHAGARHPLDAAAALPDLEAQLEVLPAPDQEAGVVRPQLEEVLAVDGEEAAGVSGALVRLAVVFPRVELLLRHFVLLVQHAPLEDAAEVAVFAVHRTVLEGFVVDAVDHRNRHHGAVSVDGGEKRGQPVGVDLAVGVQEDDHFPFGFFRAAGSRPDQALALGVADQPHFSVELLDVVIQATLEVLFVAEIVDEEDLFEDVRRRPVQNRVDGSQRAPTSPHYGTL